MVVHLDFGDVRAETGDAMDDRIGQSAIVGSDGGNDDLHGKCSGKARRMGIVQCSVSGELSRRGFRSLAPSKCAGMTSTIGTKRCPRKLLARPPRRKLFQRSATKEPLRSD